MEIRKIKCKSGNEYNIVNESWATSNSWGHKSTLIASWGEVERKKLDITIELGRIIHTKLV